MLKASKYEAGHKIRFLRDEFLSVERIPFSALVEQVRQGEIKDAKTVALVLKAKLLGL